MGHVISFYPHFPLGEPPHFSNHHSRKYFFQTEIIFAKMGSEKTRDHSYVNIFGADATKTYAAKRSKGPRSKPALGTPLGQVKLAREPARKGARRIGKATKNTPFDDIFGADISTNSEQVIFLLFYYFPVYIRRCRKV